MSGKSSRRSNSESKDVMIEKFSKDMSKLVSEATSIKTSSTLDISTIYSDSSTLSSDTEFETEAQLRDRLVAEFEARTRECTKKIDQFLQLVQERRYQRLKPC